MSCITLTTDFGLADPFVGVMKGILIDRAPGCAIVDITHLVAPQDIFGGALALMQATPYFPIGTTHVAVVDPGVGGQRLPIAIETERCILVGPDNGVLSLAAAAGSVRRVVALTDARFHLAFPSATFHGRDVFAPVAAALATGTPVGALGPTRTSFAQLTLPVLVEQPEGLAGEVIHVDRFGNLTTNLPTPRVLSRGAGVSGSIAGRTAALVTTYEDIPDGAVGVVANSWGFLEVAARNASAADLLGASRGTPVTLRWSPIPH